MLTITLSDKQEKQMNKFIKQHQKVCKLVKEQKKANIVPSGGWGNFSLEITFTAIATLASIKCKCGEELYLGEVIESSDAEFKKAETKDENKLLNKLDKNVKSYTIKLGD